MKCKRLYYYGQMLGVQVKEDYQSDALKMGKMIDYYITQNTACFLIQGDTLWQAKVFAITEVFVKLGFNINGYSGQIKFLIQEDGHPQIKGFIDLEANDKTHFIELKCTSKPDYYTNPYWIHDQVGTYFLSNPNYQYAIMWVIRVPMLKQTGAFKDESLEDYKDRCVRDMLKRPSWYFQGYDKDTGTFGLKFYRSEFDLDGLKARYRWIADEIKNCTEADYWYQDRTQCINPWKCDYMRICDSGGISNDVYERRKK